jgi:hypothetical protein
MIVIHADKLKGDAQARDSESGDLVHADRLDLQSAMSRTRFAKVVAAKLDAPDAQADVEKLLLGKLDELTREPMVEAADTSVRIVRPELFITPQVIGLTVAEPVIVNGKPAGRWRMYLLWSDGRREVADLSDCIMLPDGGRLWIHPRPGDPSPSALCGWSPRGRQAWLAGKAQVDAVDTFIRLSEAIAHYVELPEDDAAGIVATLALWSMATYLYCAWPATPYLFVGGPLGSGKSRLFDVLSRVVFRPLTSSNMTAAALFRTLHERGGVLLLDEAERLRESTPDAGEVRSILLAGYKRGGKATRLEAVADTFRTIEFDCYSPKALACIAGLPPALSSRCIHVAMFRATPGSDVPRRRPDADPRWAVLRDDLHALTLGPLGQAALELADRPGVCPFNGRDFELWQPLLALATFLQERGADGLVKLVEDHARRSIDDAAEDQTPDTDELLLRILAERVRDDLAGPTPGRILAQAKQDEPELFGRWTARTVANHLARYGIRAVKANGTRTYRDVTLAALSKVQKHYRLDLGIAASLTSLAPGNGDGKGQNVPQDRDASRTEGTQGPGRCALDGARQ